jgi:hypothetical protein
MSASQTFWVSPSVMVNGLGSLLDPDKAGVPVTD